MIAKDSAEKFVAYWLAQAGSERSQCHQFWDSLLGAVPKAYGWPTDLSEPEVVSRLFEMYEKLMAK